MSMYNEIDRCRISGSKSLINVLSLGEQCLTGVFPKTASEVVTRGPLDLVWCPESGLLQLKQSYSLDEMYGDNYGYRSGLNASMVRHLTNKVHALEKVAALRDGDIVVDIGSNDATTLKAYSGRPHKLGVDPTGPKFREYYTDDIRLIPEFFSAAALREALAGAKARIVTSIAMFYDLEQPAAFVRDVESILADDGIWHLEQSYMPSMLRTNSYDTICHEHLEFYSLRVVKNLLEAGGFRVIDVQMNSINGGSFAVTACKNAASYSANDSIIEWLLRQEEDLGIDTPAPYRAFEERVYKHRKHLRELIEALNSEGKRVIGYGASTKGNVLLQFCGFTSKQIPCIAEVNEQKFGCVTPGSHIPIVWEDEVMRMAPDYLFVLPWHFKHSIVEREADFLARGGKMIFPLPEIEIV